MFSGEILELFKKVFFTEYRRAIASKSLRKHCLK